MRLILNEILRSIADKSINDDAFEIWLKLKDENKSCAAPGAFYSRHNIKKDDEYLYISFVDTETGELLFINCLEKLHNAMIRFNLYPDFILNGLKRSI